MGNCSATLVVAGLAWLASAACGLGGAATAEPTTAASPTQAAASPAAVESEPTSPPAASSGMDLQAIDVCEILPHAEFAALAGGTPLQEIEQQGPFCAYTLDPGDGSAHSYVVHVSSPEAVSALMDYVRDYLPADWIDGLGDDAYVAESDAGPGYDLAVLVEGRYGITINGPDPDVMQAAAQLLLERITP